jgi:hypothetical protein
MKYVKLPIPVEAVQWFKEGDHHKVVCNHFEPATGYKEYGIKTREGWHAVVPGCWIMGPGAEGEFWAIQDSIFRKTYAPADSANEVPRES